MGVNDVIHNVESKLDLSSIINLTMIRTVENETDSLFYNDTASSESIPFSSTPLFFRRSIAFLKNSTDDKFQYYIIGVYTFFITLFVLGILIIIARKLYKACSVVSDDDYDSASREGLNVPHTPVSEHHVNVDSTDVIGTQQEYDSDYDYFSDASNGDKDDSKDTPPDYEGPPSYSAVPSPSYSAVPPPSYSAVPPPSYSAVPPPSYSAVSPPSILV